MYTTTLTTSLAAIGLFALRVAAQEVELNDYPMQCDAVCAPVANLTQQCDWQSGDSDRQESNCICDATNASTAIPECEACYAAFDRDGHDNDIYEFIRECGFTTTIYNTATATASASGGMVAGAPVANSREGAIATATATGNATLPDSGTVATATASVGTGTAAQNSASTGALAPASTGAASSNSIAGGIGLVAGLLGVAALL